MFESRCEETSQAIASQYGRMTRSCEPEPVPHVAGVSGWRDDDEMLKRKYEPEGSTL